MFMTGNFCFRSMRHQKRASFFYSEKFSVTADPPAKLHVILKVRLIHIQCLYVKGFRIFFLILKHNIYLFLQISAGIDCTIVCARLTMPNRISQPTIAGVGGYNITVTFNTEWFPYSFFFALALDGKNSTDADMQAWISERKPGFW